RAGDLDAAIGERRRRRRHRPVAVADVASAGQEVESLAMGDPLPALVSRGEQLAAPRIEATMQLLHEGERLVGEDLLAARDVDVTGDHDGHAPGAPFGG